MMCDMGSERVRLLLIFVVMIILSGCSVGKGGGAFKRTQVSGEWPAVTRIDDGRHGFIIREKPSMFGEWADDFESAVGRMEDRDYEGAIELLEKVVAQSPGTTAPYIDIAICYERTGQSEQAKKHLETALKLVPDHPVASNEYGLLLRKAGRFADARDVYEKALTSFPEYLPLHKNLGILCDLYLGDMDCALEHYEFYSKAKPEDEQVKIWVADFHLRSGRGE